MNETFSFPKFSYPSNEHKNNNNNNNNNNKWTGRDNRIVGSHERVEVIECLSFVEEIGGGTIFTSQ